MASVTHPGVQANFTGHFHVQAKPAKPVGQNGHALISSLGNRLYDAVAEAMAEDPPQGFGLVIVDQQNNLIPEGQRVATLDIICLDRFDPLVRQTLQQLTPRENGLLSKLSKQAFQVTNRERRIESENAFQACWKDVLARLADAVGNGQCVVAGQWYLGSEGRCSEGRDALRFPFEKGVWHRWLS